MLHTSANLTFILDKLPKLKKLSGKQLSKLRTELTIAKLDGFAEAEVHIRLVENEIVNRFNELIGR